MNNHGPQRFEVTQHRENDNRYLKKKKYKGSYFHMRIYNRSDYIVTSIIAVCIIEILLKRVKVTGIVAVSSYGNFP